MVEIALLTSCDASDCLRLERILHDAYVSVAPTVDEYLGLDPVLVVVGPLAPLPLVEVRRAYKRFGDAHVLLLPAAADLEAVRDELATSPGVHRSVRCLPLDAVTEAPERVRAAFEAAVAAQRIGAMRHAAHDALLDAPPPFA